MRRLVILISAALFGVTTSVQAQKVDEALLNKKIGNAETASKDAKKSTKPGTWIDLGKAYFDAGSAVSSSVYRGMDVATIDLSLGQVSETTENVGAQTFQKRSYDYLDLYMQNGKLSYWIVTHPIFAGTIEKSVAAIEFSYGLDNSTGNTTKVKEALVKIVNYYKQVGDNDYAQKNYGLAAEAFGKAYDLAKQPAVNVVDTSTGYNAGLLYIFDQSYANAEKYLAEAVANGFEAKGDTYFFLAEAYMKQEKMDQAKQTLLTAIQKYSQNTNVIEGLLSLYATTGDNPEEVIPYAQKAIDADPQNPELYAGMGRIYDKLGDMDKAIEVFRSALNLIPEDFSVNYNLGLMMLKKADGMSKELTEKRTTSRAEYALELAKVYAEYGKAIPIMEKAHEIDPTDLTTVEMLKNLYFRLRDETPENMENYNKYNDLFKSM